jgi:hypothetical protein
MRTREGRRTLTMSVWPVYPRGSVDSGPLKKEKKNDGGHREGGEGCWDRRYNHEK